MQRAAQHRNTTRIWISQQRHECGWRETKNKKFNFSRFLLPHLIASQQPRIPRFVTRSMTNIIQMLRLHTAHSISFFMGRAQLFKHEIKSHSRASNYTHDVWRGSRDVVELLLSRLLDAWLFGWSLRNAKPSITTNTQKKIFDWRAIAAAAVAEWEMRSLENNKETKENEKRLVCNLCTVFFSWKKARSWVKFKYDVSLFSLLPDLNVKIQWILNTYLSAAL